MKKTILTLLSIAVAFTAIAPAQAQDQKVLAIIDTAIDSNKVSSVVHEVCFTANKSCPNGLNTMEGKGSAASPLWPSDIRKPVYHGHNMAQAALAIDSTIKIVFVRIANVTPAGDSTNAQTSLISAIEWVSNNAMKYGVDAVSISQSAIDPINMAGCTTNTKVINAVSLLNLNKVPTFAATGNNKSQTIIGFPSCVSGVTAVGALAAFPKTPTVYNNFAGDTNRGPGLDMVAPGNISIVRYDGSLSETSSTSGATVIAAAAYLSRNKYGSFLEYVSALPKVLNFPYTNK